MQFVVFLLKNRFGHLCNEKMDLFSTLRLSYVYVQYIVYCISIYNIHRHEYILYGCYYYTHREFDERLAADDSSIYECIYTVEMCGCACMCTNEITGLSVCRIKHGCAWHTHASVCMIYTRIDISICALHEYVWCLCMSLSLFAIVFSAAAAPLRSRTRISTFTCFCICMQRRCVNMYASLYLWLCMRV